MLNNDLSEIIQRSILAHELGHAILHKSTTLSIFHEIALFDNIDRLEYENNIFASKFLLEVTDVKEWQETH